MPIITLTSDFGLKSFGISSLKGMLLKACPSINIVDISHDIESLDKVTASYMIKNASKYFPDHTIHFTNINIKEGNNRYLIIERNKQYYICPDNGMVSIMFANQDYKVFAVKGLEKDFSYKELNNKLVEIIAFAETNKDLSSFGQETNSYLKAITLQPIITGDLIKASVIQIDINGNLVLNLTKEQFYRFVGDSRFIISARSASFTEISNHYSDVKPGDILCLFNEADMLEIAQNTSSANTALGLKTGDIFLIERI